MQCCYDPRRGYLVFSGKRANKKYWDNQWISNNFPACVEVKKNPFIVYNTRKYLSEGARVLEGGCGKGDKVYALSVAGFDAVGVDYAKETVSKINETVPQLKIDLGDIRHLPYADENFDGYWSIGVVEHFYEGYYDVATEMHRVLKKGGYLFLTVPIMSPLRILKQKFNVYPECDGSPSIEKDFYQFALSRKSVLDMYTSLGFELVAYHKRDGIKGLKDELVFLRPVLQKVWEAKSLPARAAKKILNIITTPVSNHMGFFVFKKL